MKMEWDKLNAQVAWGWMLGSAVALGACSSSEAGTDGDPQLGGASGTLDGDSGMGGKGPRETGRGLPRAGIYFEDEAIEPGDFLEEVVDISEPVLGEKEEVEYPYDPKEEMDDENAKPTKIEIRSNCTTKTYDLKSNPQKLMLHGIDNAITWPGALLQGASYRDGSLRSLSLDKQHRAPLTVVIKDVYNNSDGSSYRAVENPSFGTVTDAVSDIIVTANEDDLPLGGSVDYRFEETKDVSRFMLRSRVSARYGIASGSLSAGINKSSSHRTVVINLVQKLFDVEVEEPPTSDAWFSEEFFEGGLQDKKDRGEISDINPPVYVSKVTYGRMLTYTMTTTASSADIRAMLQASVKTLAASGSLKVSSRHESIRSNSRVEMVSIGGDQAVALTAANSGDWGSFFAKDFKLTSAVPISMEFKNLYDNTPAGVTEAGTYEEEICTPQIVVPGPFDFGMQDVHERPDSVGAVHQVVVGDFNDDGAQDLMWNELRGKENNFYVGYGGGARLAIEESACEGNACSFSGETSWGQYRPLSGDFTGDGRDDLVWAPQNDALAELGYVIYLLPATEDGFEKKPIEVSVVGEAPGDAYRDPLVSDMNGDGTMDLVFSFFSRSGKQESQSYQIVLSNPDGDVPFLALLKVGGPAYTNENPQTFSTLDALDVDNDGATDLLWNLMGQQRYSSEEYLDHRNVLFLRTGSVDTPAEDFMSTVTTVREGGGWSSYEAVAGDFDGDGDVDRAFLGINGAWSEDVPVHQASFGEGAYQVGSLQWWPTQNMLAGENRHLAALNINGDASQDVMLTSFLPLEDDSSGAPVKNVVATLKGVSGSTDGFFNLGIEPQVHPVHHDWSNYSHVIVGDFNGDRLDDVLWNNAALDNSVFIAYAKRDKNN